MLLSAIGVGLALAATAPQLAARLGWLVNAGVFLVIYLVMLGVNARGVIRAFRRPRPTLIALGINFAFTPFFAWFLGWLFLQGHPDIWVGLILYLLTPCIGWYLVFTDLADGDVELGVSLLFWNILLQLLLTPVYLWLLAGRIVPIDFMVIARSVALFLALPFVLAWLTRRLVGEPNGQRGAILEKMPLGLLKTASLMVVIAAMFASQGEVLLENPRVVWLMIAPGAVFFVAIFVIAITVGRLAGLGYPETALLVFTTAARNSEASLAVAVTAFASPLVPLTVVIGPAIELPVLILMVRALKWLRGKWWPTEESSPPHSPAAQRGRGAPLQQRH